jgi:hypothetical protein
MPRFVHIVLTAADLRLLRAIHELPGVAYHATIRDHLRSASGLRQKLRVLDECALVCGQWGDDPTGRARRWYYDLTDLGRDYLRISTLHERQRQISPSEKFGNGPCDNHREDILAQKIGGLTGLTEQDLVNMPRPRKRGDRPVELDTTPVHVRAEALHAIWWRGRQWAVTEYGIEALDGTYSFEAKRLTEDIEDWGWPAHMAEKDWVDTEELATAWLVALAIHGAHAPPAQIRKALRRTLVHPAAP